MDGFWNMVLNLKSQSQSTQHCVFLFAMNVSEWRQKFLRQKSINDCLGLRIKNNGSDC